jgi:hypothetical protein
MRERILGTDGLGYPLAVRAATYTPLLQLGSNPRPFRRAADYFLPTLADLWLLGLLGSFALTNPSEVTTNDFAPFGREWLATFSSGGGRGSRAGDTPVPVAPNNPRRPVRGRPPPTPGGPVGGRSAPTLGPLAAETGS